MSRFVFSVGGLLCVALLAAFAGFLAGLSVQDQSSQDDDFDVHIDMYLQSERAAAQALKVSLILDTNNSEDIQKMMRGFQNAMQSYVEMRDLLFVTYEKDRVLKSVGNNQTFEKVSVYLKTQETISTDLSHSTR